MLNLIYFTKKKTKNQTPQPLKNPKDRILTGKTITKAAEGTS